MTAHYDRTDLELLDALQDDIPLVSHPWKLIADQLGISEPELLQRMGRLQAAGILRGVSPVLESRRLGITAATLIALRVPESRIHEVARIINTYPEVSHNYRRDHEYSVWFTLAAATEERIVEVLDEILKKTGISEADMLNLPTRAQYKIDVRFSCCPDDGEV
ncbi:MAG: AsnC family transcriptional regulator [Methanoregula sp.]|nr:AsnC family transcriptional regulator [Methanoregula sp.]